jgi:hypothetical protein
LDLDYDARLHAEVSPDMIVAMGERARRRWRTGLVVGACAAVVAFACLSVGLLGRVDGDRGAHSDPASALAAAPEFAAHPPDGEPAVVDSSVVGWTSVVWWSADGQLCAGSVGVAGSARGTVALNCLHVEGDGMFPNGAAPVQLPAFQALPMPADNRGNVLVIGFARADVATVDIDFFGHHVSAAVHPVASANHAAFAAYAAWLPLNGAVSYGTADITSLVARDAAGTVLG